jgi:hypothetical protein
MSGFNSQGVGAAACANADVGGAASVAATARAAVTKTDLVEILVILHSPSNRLEKSRSRFLEQITNDILPSTRLFAASRPHETL